jgi:hypothetical protein
MGRIAGLIAALALLQGGVVLAQSAAPVPGSGTTSAPSQTVPQPGKVLGEDEIRQKLREEGYTEVTELRLQGPSYEAKAIRDGRNINLTVDARTGSIRSTY